jgi:hypothetical protein
MKKAIIAAMLLVMASCAKDRCPHFAGNNSQIYASSEKAFILPYDTAHFRYMTINVIKENGKEKVYKFKVYSPLCLGIYKGKSVLCDGNGILLYNVKDYQIIQSSKTPY